jgi:DMSO reductase anchor subunit
MIYASLKPIPAWRHPLVLPVYLLFALLTGLALLFVLMTAMLKGQGPATMAVTLAMLGTMLVALKWLYWYEIGRATPPFTRGAAIGLPGRDAQVFERPHTEANYITREMGFVFARRHAQWLRAFALVGFGLVPLAALLLSFGLPDLAGAALTAASVAALAGAFAERWLFFAQARHLVTLYY